MHYYFVRAVSFILKVRVSGLKTDYFQAFFGIPLEGCPMSIGKSNTDLNYHLNCFSEYLVTVTHPFFIWIPTEGGIAILTSGSQPRGAPCPRQSKGTPTLTIGTPPLQGELTMVTWPTTFAHLTLENSTAKKEGKKTRMLLF